MTSNQVKHENQDKNLSHLLLTILHLSNCIVFVKDTNVKVNPYDLHPNPISFGTF